MAGISTVQINKEDFDERFLTCKICEKQYDDSHRLPKYLPCLHTYCKPCLGDYIKEQPEFDCPECRQKTKTPKSKADGFPSNFIVLNQKSFFETQKKVKHGLSIPCQSCRRSENPAAVSFCSDCRAFLCQFCHDAHKHTSGLSPHQVKTIAELSKTPEAMEESIFRQKDYCNKGRNHRNQELTLFCDNNRCQLPICLQCAFLDHAKGDGHEPVEIEKAVEKYRAKIEGKLENVKTRHNKIASIIEGLDKELVDLEENSDSQKEQIEQFYATYLKDLENRRKKLLSHVQTQKAKVQQTLLQEKEDYQTHLAVTDSTWEFTDNALQHSSEIEILAAKDDICQQLDKVSAQPTKERLSLVKEFPRFFCPKSVPTNIVSSTVFTGYADKLACRVVTSFAKKGNDCKSCVTPLGMDGKPLQVSGLPIAVKIKDPDDQEVESWLQDKGDGTYDVRYRPQKTGKHSLTVNIYDKIVEGNPYIIDVQV
ncbi:E3 ubiquitin-protein ligase TRIM71-like [Glandiceps talaboti]